ncbi:fasciclin domain-containing protein [Anaerolinea thermophila]|uniref:fasciclin domain-containing protein n=3 Tax=Anaerolinea TaxID=233189 RepID=UPI00262F530A|nr:fasciclin domain-containing protein [Anaerolinea thermophila]
MNRITLFSLFIALALILAACAPAATPAPSPTPLPPTPMPQPTPTEAPKTIVDLAVADGRFNTLVAAVQAAGLVDTLKGEGPFTVFAPTDDAFAKLPAGTLDELLKPENKQKLTDILTYHVVAGKVMAADVVKLSEAETLLGTPVMIKVDGNMVKINDATVVITDVVGSNGVIHVIDSVLLPPADIVDSALADKRFSTLAAAIQAAGLVDTLKGKGPFTVLAPTDDAFAKLPAGTLDELLKPENKDTLIKILTYHVIPGRYNSASLSSQKEIATVEGNTVDLKVDGKTLKVNDANVIVADVLARNGIIHAIDTVILPPKDIVDTAVENGSFNTLAAALQAAGLVDTLKGKGPFTVFAPTDEAFAKLPAGTVETLLKPENKDLLVKILTYHVVPGKLKAADVLAASELKTVQGFPVQIRTEDGKAFVDNAQIVLTDVKASNGVIHVIDTVIIPPDDIVDTAIKDGRFKTLVAAVQAAGLVETLKGEGPFTVFAPTDQAFAKLPAGTLTTLLKPENKQQLADILTYHVVAGKLPAAQVVKQFEIKTVQGQPVLVKVDGDKVFINNAQVIITDVRAGNGIIHVIDAVILPPKDIVDTAAGDARFKTLVAAVQAAGLVETLKGEGPFTVFAPTDQAFAKLPAGTLDELLKPENKQKLTDILTYHVVSGKVYAKDVVNLKEATTVLGKNVTIKVMDGKVYINDAQVIITDILCSNGVIHVIDTVILPPQ